MRSIILILLISIIYSYDLKCTPEIEADNAKFDYLVLSTYWIGNKCTTNQCHLPKSVNSIPPTFLISALRPSDKSIHCCNYNGRETDMDSFTKSYLKYDYSVQYEVSNFWPSLFDCNLPEYSFVEYGSCISDLNENPSKYWKKSIELYHQYDIWDLLHSNDYQFGKEKLYKLEYLRQFIINRNLINTKLGFKCDSNDKLSLTGIDICFSNDGKYTPVDCTDDENTCGDYIYLDDIVDILKDEGSCDF